MKTIKTLIIAFPWSIAILIAVSLLGIFLFSFKRMVDTQTALLDRTLTPQAGEDLAKRTLRELKYGKDGYFWADTVDGTNVVLLGKATEGTNRHFGGDRGREEHRRATRRRRPNRSGHDPARLGRPKERRRLGGALRFRARPLQRVGLATLNYWQFPGLVGCSSLFA